MRLSKTCETCCIYIFYINNQDLTKATSTKVIVSKDKSWTVEVGNKTIQLVPYNDVTIW